MGTIFVCGPFKTAIIVSRAKFGSKMMTQSSLQLFFTDNRSSIESTVVSDLESFHSVSEMSGSQNGEDKNHGKKQISINEARTADLEMAVLVQVGRPFFKRILNVINSCCI